jgi:hypothetical protein
MKKVIPVACCHTVFTNEQRSDYKNAWNELEKRRLGITDIEMGFEHQFSGDKDTLHLLNEWISLERKCCPFLIFTVRVSNENEPIFLQITGTDQAKSFLRNELNEKIQIITTQLSK